MAGSINLRLLSQKFDHNGFIKCDVVLVETGKLEASNIKAF